VGAPSPSRGDSSAADDLTIQPSAWGLLAALTALNVLSYVDRQLVVTLAPLLMAELGLSRAQVGLLVGASFIVVYALVTLPFGAASDRTSRPRLIALGLAVWTIGILLSAAASGFWSLALLRGLVGVGEAALAPAALSMLGDRFPRDRLGLASGVFYTGVPLGFAISFALAGWIGPWLGWRACFLVLGAIGLGAVAAVMGLSDPPRRGVSPGPQARPPGAVRVRSLARALAERPTLLLISLAGAALAFASSASQHTITWLVQDRGLPYAHAAFLSAAILLVAGLAGNLAIGAVTDAWRRRRRDGRLLGLAVLGTIGLSSSAVFYRLSPMSPLFVPCWFLTQAWMMGWFGALLAALDERAPPELRATVLGFALLTLNLLGVAVGPWVTGLIGDRASLTSGLLASLVVGACGLVALAFAVRVAAEPRPPESQTAS
jgi:predicted MFS family arabinose efflux permease